MDKDTQAPPLAVVAPERQDNVDTAFLDLLKLHRRGNCMDELSQSLRELNAAVQLTGKGGVITLKIAVKPNGGVNGAVQIRDDIKLTLPKIDKGASLFYINNQGALQKDDPDQTHLDLKVVNGGPADGKVELRRVQ